MKTKTLAPPADRRGRAALRAVHWLPALVWSGTAPGLSGCTPVEDNLTGFSGAPTAATMTTTESSSSSATTPGAAEDSGSATGTAPTGASTEPTTSGADTLDTGSAEPSTGDPACAQGTVVCEGETAKVCDGLGGFASEEACPTACAPGFGCSECSPGASQCDGQVAKQCKGDGSGYEETVCDEVQDVSCDPDLGTCVGPCAPGNLGTSYIGCEYYPVVTANQVDQAFTFAVVVSNVSDEDADITITRGGASVLDIVVTKKSVEVIPLPWVTELKVGFVSQRVADGAYRLRSTRPVTVYQYSPLEYTKDGEFSYSNDASLLMPTNVWGKDTFVVGRNSLDSLGGMYAVIARADDTTVEVTPSATGQFIQPGSEIAEDGTGVVVLNEGDVLQVLSKAAGGMPDISDITGTRVVSDKPVQIIGGHMCTYVPYDVLACDHLEESNLPLQNLDKVYLVSTPLVKALDQAPEPKARIVRMVATADATTLTYDPPQPGAPAALAKAGDNAEFSTSADFKITASAKIVVSEYFLGQEAGGDAGDPSMTIAVPIEQYRDNYSFHAPVNYESNFVNVLAPTAAKISLDGQPVGGYASIGATGYSVARVQLANNVDGDHFITGDQPFGVQVYGYGQYTSYWYPAGLDLKLIPQ